MDKKIKELEVRIKKLEYVLGIFLNIKEPSNRHLGEILNKTPKEYKSWKKGFRNEAIRKASWFQKKHVMRDVLFFYFFFT